MSKSGALSDHAFARKMRRRGPQRSANLVSVPNVAIKIAATVIAAVRIRISERLGFIYPLHDSSFMTITPPCAVNSRASLSSLL